MKIGEKSFVTFFFFESQIDFYILRLNGGKVS